MGQQLRHRAGSAALIIGFFLLWELFCWGGGISDVVLPRPSKGFVTLFLRFPAIWPHAIQTLYTTLVGFGFGIAIGVTIGVLIGSSKLAYDVAYPLLVGFSSIPKVAGVPICVRWLGPGPAPAVLTAMILCVFPIVVNVATGLATTEPELEDVMRSLRASRFDILTNVGLPRAMPYFFASLKVAVTQAFVGTVIAETVASNRGIGNLMMIASSNFDVPLVFAGLLVLAVLGVALYVIFSFIEVRVTGWAHRKDEFAAGCPPSTPGSSHARIAEFLSRLARGLGVLAVGRRRCGRRDENPLHARLEAAGQPCLAFLGATEGLLRGR